MKYLVQALAVSAICLSACGKKDGAAAGDPVVVTSNTAIEMPTPNRMNYLIGRSLVVKRAVPSQMTGECNSKARIRGNKSFCRPQINALARNATFDVGACRETGKTVTCQGSVETKIGSADVVVTFERQAENWQGKIVEIVNGTWRPKT